MTLPAVRRAGPGALRALGNVGGLLRDSVVAPLASFVPRDWLVLRFDRGLAEVTRKTPWPLEGMVTSPRPLSTVLQALELAREDPRLKGVMVRFGTQPIGWAKSSALARSFGLLRASGKKLVAYAESGGNAGAWLGGLADRFWMAPEGRLDLLGVRSQNVFLRRLLDRVRVRPEVIAAGRYKSAAETLDRESMSEPAREALEAVVDEFYEALVAGLAAGRAGDADAARRWIDEGPYLAGEAVEAGIVDELVYPDELPERLAKLGGRTEKDASARMIGEASYIQLARPRFVWHSLARGRPQIAVVPLTGMIRRSSGSPRGVVGVLRRLARNDAVRAVVLRIDSPGGDSLASDLIWRAVGKLDEAKPVIASMGDTAASGGYYAAMAAREIIAEPTTLTGSIGVVLMGLEIAGLLEDLGIRSDAVQRGRHADIYDVLGARDAEQRALLRRQVERIYRDFVRKAAECRGMAESELEQVAQGRVWTGAQAHARGLVDALGGVDTALERARALAGLGSDEGEAVYHAPPSGSLAQLLRPSPLDTILSPGAQSFCPIRIPLK